MQDSISAYYWGPIRDVFVGTLVGTAVCLVVYRGPSAIEDYSLNFAGFFAFFVAFVPTDLSDYLAMYEPAERPDALVQALVAVTVSTVSVVLVSAGFVLAEKKVGHWDFPKLMEVRRTRVVVRSTSVVLGLFVAFWLFALLGAILGFWVGGTIFGRWVDGLQWVHWIAAILLFVGMALAMSSHNWLGEPKVTQQQGRRYGWLVVAMVLGVPGALLLALAEWQFKVETYSVIALEAWGVGCFAIFWIREAKRTWGAQIGS